MTYRFKAITHNIAGGTINSGSPTALGTLNEQIATWSPHVVGAQEVCQSQLTQFSADHPDWNTVYTPMRPDHLDCGPGPQGQMLASPWPLSDIERIDLGYNDGPKDFVLTLATITIPGIPGIQAKVGTTHLRAYGTEEARIARRRQCQRILTACAPYVDTGWPVVIFGDFNCNPGADALDFMYAVGEGDFHECDQTDTANTSTRDGALTFPGTGSKLDYIWFSTNSTPGTPGTISGGTVAAPTSDHSLLRGWADINTSVMKVQP